ncbi:MAG: PstS family phosphate ABC transporter substrate-binding protein [Calditerrivibrio sp.]|uniref:PstS family phosphate ABC transporter substrate-binding protein n=1 Tax=Calditerrivibrio sp. TaxID=2792612 RepID=UPI003D127E95
MKKLILSIAIVSIAAVNLFASSMVDSNLPNYKKVKGVSGNLKSVGSDTMNNLMTLWAEKFMSYYPNVKIEIEGKGSSTAPAALISGTSHFGPMSREMKAKEMDAFEKKYGYKPTGLKTSIDMLAVYVNKDNPIQCLSLEEVDAIFSKTRKRGYQKDIVTWGDLGLTGEWADKPISLYGRNSASGTYGYFKEHVFKNGDYKDTVKEQPGSSSVVQGVTSDRYAIGYSGIGYKTAGVKAVALSEKKGGKCINADAAHAYTGEYPLARFLYIYVNYTPGSKLDPLRAEFLRLIFSKQGQEVVVKDGYFPITNKVAEAELAKVGLK